MREKKMKTVSDNGKYRATHTATLSLSKLYAKELVESGDEDFMALANMNGERIAIVSFPQPLVNKNDFEVGIFEPFEGMINKRNVSKIEVMVDGKGNKK